MKTNARHFQSFHPPVMSLAARIRRSAFTKLFVGITSVVLFAGQTVMGATLVWDGGGSDANLATSVNWTTDATPVANDTLVFDGVTRLAVTNNFAAGTVFNGLTFNASAGAFTLSGNQIGLNGSITDNSLNAETISAAIALSATQTANVSSMNGSLTLSGIISGTGFGLTKTGSGLLTLSNAANTFTGPVTISGGTLSIGTDSTGVANALGSGASGAGNLVIDGGTLRVTTASAQISTNRSILLGNSGAGTGGTIDNGVAISYNGVMANNGGTNTFTKTGAGTFSLGGVNTYTGSTFVNQGNLKLDFTAIGAPTSNIINSGSTLVLGGVLSGLNNTQGNFLPGSATLNVTSKSAANSSQTFNGLTLNSGSSAITTTLTGGGHVLLALGAINRNSGGVVTFTLPAATPTAIDAITTTTANTNGILGGWAKTSTGDWAANDGSNNIISYTGYTSFGAPGGTLTAAGGALNVRTIVGDGAISAQTTGTTDVNTILSTDSAVRTIGIASGATLRLGTFGAIRRLNASTDSTLTIGVAGSSLTAGGAANTAGEILLDSTVLTNNTGAGMTIASNIVNNGTGAVSVVYSGNGSITTSGTNTFTGGTFINSGRVVGALASSFGATTSAVTILPGAQALLSGAVTYAQPFNIAGTGTTENVANGVLRLGNGSTVSGLITLLADSRIGANGTGTATTISSKITGAYNLDFSAVTTATFTLSGTTSDFTGNLSLNGFVSGTPLANLATTLKLGSGTAIPDGTGKGNIIINGGTSANITFDLNNQSETINGLVATGANVARALVTNSGATTNSVLTLGAGDATSTFGGVISSGASKTLGITKTGLGTQTFSGANTYTGATLVNLGTLALNNTTGTVLGNTAITVGNATITPGVSGNATLLIQGANTVGVAAGGSITLSGGDTTTTGRGTLSMVDGVANTLTIFSPTVAANNFIIGGGASSPAALTFELGATGVNDTIALGANSKMLVNAGAGIITLSPLSTFTGTGTYNLITYGSGNATYTGALTLATPSNNAYTFALTNGLTAAALTITQATGGATAFWNGNVNGAWNAFADNWVTTAAGGTLAALPDLNTNLTFSVTGGGSNLNTTLGQNFTVNSMKFTSAADATHAVTIGGTNTLTINAAAVNGNAAGNGITVDASSGAHTITSAVTLGNAQTWTNNSTNTLTVSGAITGSGLLTIGGTGTGGVTLSGTNTSLTGGVTLASGAFLNVNNVSALGTVAGTFTILGGTLDNTTGAALTLTANNPVALNGNFTFTGGTGTTHDLNLGTGAVTLGAARQITVNNASTLTLGGAVGGNTFGITKAGAGILALSGVIGTTSGGLAVTGGTLIVGNAANTFTGAVSVDGASSVLQVTSGSNGTSTSAPLGIFTGGTNIKQITLTNGGIFRPMASWNFNGVTAALPGDGYQLVFGTGGGVIDTPSGVTLSLDDGTAAGTTATTANYLANSGTTSITKTGVGTLVLAKQQFVTATFNLNAGTTSLSGADTLGIATNAVSVASGATLNLGGQTMTRTNPLTLSGTGLTSAPVGALTSASGTGTWVGAVTIATGGATIGGGVGALTLNATMNNAGNTLTIAHAAGRTTLSGVISGLGAMVINGSSSGDIVLSGANTYTGGTTLNAGSSTVIGVSSTGTNGIPTNGPFGAGATPLILAGGQLRAGTGGPFNIGNTVSVTGDTTFYTLASEKSLTFSGPVTLSGNRILTSTVGTTVGGASVIFNGAIGGGAVSLTKAGAGNLTLASSSNTYSGGTIVNAGNLILTGTLPSTGAVTVNTGGTLTMINNSANPQSISAALTLATGSTLGFDLGVNTAASDSFTTLVAAVANGTIGLSINPITGFNTGTFNLINAASGLTSTFATYAVSSAPGGFTYSTTTSDTQVQLNVAAATVSGSVYWRGNINNSWSAFSGANTNWFTDATGLSNAGYNPAAANTVIFSASNTSGTTVNSTLDNNYTINDLQFTSNQTGVTAVSIGTGTLQTYSLTLAPTNPATGISVAANSGAVTISAPVILGAPQSWSVDGTGSSLTVSGILSGSAANTLSLSGGGAGVIALSSGANTYSGPTTVGNGVILQAGATTSFSPNSDVTVSGTGILRTNGFTNTILSLAGDGKVQNNTATAVTLTTGSTANTIFSGIIENGSTAALNLTKQGSGTMTLSGVSNTFTGVVTVAAGTLNVSGSINSGNAAGSGKITVGNTASVNAVMNISGTVNATFATVPSISIGSVASAIGDIQMTGGTLTTASEIHLGEGLGAYAGFTLSGGTATIGSWLVVGNNNDRAVFNQTGGSATVSTNNMTIAAGGTGAIGVATLSGGTFTTTAGGILVGERGAGTLNVMGTASLNLGTASNGITIGPIATQTGWAGQANLLGGTVLTNKVARGIGTGTATLNLNGGTLQASVANATFMTGLDNAYVYSGGGTIDSNGFGITVAQALKTPAGSGVSAIALTSGGSGYIDTPIVTFSGGGGSGATAIANISGGVVTGFTITNPGIGYALAPTVTLTGGGSSTAAVVGTASTAANISGGITKAGLGTLTLTGLNTYTGGTTVNAGTLALGVNSSLATTGNVTVNTGGTFDLATFTNTIGTLILSGGSVTSGTGILTASTYDLRSGSASAILAGATAAVGITKTTAGTVTLSGVNTFSGPVNVNGGVLAFSASSNLGNAASTNTISLNGGNLSYTGSTNLDILANRVVTVGASGGTLDVSDASGTLTVNGGLDSGSTGTLTKTGPGTVIIPNAVSASSASVAVTSGTLKASFGTGGIAAVTVGSTGTLSLVNAAADTLTLAGTGTNLNLSGGALTFELGASGINDQLTANSASTSGSVTLNFASIAGFGAGTYNLISATSGLNGASYLLGTAPTGFNYTITTTDTLVSLTTAAYTPIYWKGGVDNSWNTTVPGTNFTSDLAGTTDAGHTPLAAETVIFSATNATVTSGGAITTTLDGNQTIDSLQFLNGTGTTPTTTSVSISQGSSGTLTISPVSSSGGIAVFAQGGAVTISAPVTVGAVQTWNVDGTAPSSLNISGDVNFNALVSKTGAGSVTLSGNNTGPGGFTLTGGQVNLNSATALGTGTFTINNGTTLDNTSSGAITLTANNAQSWNGNFSFAGSNNLSLGAGPVNLNNPITVTTTANTLTVGGVINGLSGLTKTGNGILVLGGNNTYSGATLVNAGTLSLSGANTSAVTLAAGTLNVNNSAALGSGTFTITGGSLGNSSGSVVVSSTNNAIALNGSFAYVGPNNLNLGTGTITPSATQTITLTAGALTLGGNIAGASGLTTAGSAGTLNLNGTLSFVGAMTVGGGTVNLNGVNSFLGGFSVTGGTALLNGSNSYSGTVAVSGGSLKIGNSTALATTVSPTLSGTGTLDLNGINVTLANIAASVAGNTITNSGAADATLTLSTTASTTLAALVTDGSTNKTALSVINPNGGWALSNASNTFSGGINLLNNAASGTRLSITTITSVGTAAAITSSTYGRGTITIGQVATDKAGIYFNSAGQTLLNPIVMNTSLGTDRRGIRIDVTGITLAGTLTANLADIYFTSNAAAATANLTGQVTGAFGLVIDSTTSGTSQIVTLNNATASPNDYAGNTIINNGAATGRSATLTLGASNQIPNGTGKGNVTINTSTTGVGTLNLAGFDETINGLTGTGTIDGASGTPTFTVGDNNATSTFAGVFKNTIGTLTVNKTGTGTLTLSAVSTSTGNLNVNQGTVSINGTGKFTGNVIVASGATLQNTGGGTDSLGGTLTVQSGGVFDNQQTGAETVSAFTLGGTGIGGTGAWVNNASGVTAGAVTSTAGIVLSADTTIGGVGNISAASAISDGGSAYALTKAGTGTATLSGANTYTGTTTISGGTLQLGAAGTTGTLSTSSSIVDNGNFTINRTNAVLQGTDFSGAAITGTGSLTQAGTGGTTTLVAANTYVNTLITAGTLQIGNAGTVGTLGTGTVAISSGATLAFNRSNTYTLGTGNLVTGAGAVTLTTAASVAASVDNQFNTTGALIFGATAGVTTVNSLDLTNGNSTFGSLVVNTNSASADTITVGSGKTLTINGNVTIGPVPTAANQVAKLTIGGGGTLNVATPAAGTIQIGNNSSATASLSEAATLVLTGLNSVSLNVSNTGTIRVSNTTGTNTSGNQATLLLPTPTSGITSSTPVTTLTAANLNVGDGSGNGAAAGQTNTITLGTGLTTLNVNTVNIGTGGRDFGQIIFASGNGTLKLRAADGSSRAAFNIGTGGAQTGVGMGTGVTGNLVDFTGHSSDLLISTLLIGNQYRNVAYANTLNFDTGTLDATGVQIGYLTTPGGTQVGATFTDNLNISGGTVTIGSSGLDMGTSTATAGTVTKTVIANVNISGGTVTIANNSSVGAAVRMVNAIAASGNLSMQDSLNITGGTVTLAGNIIKGSVTGVGTGTSTATVTLNGGTLDMGGNSIGASASLISFTTQQGTLQNLNELNGGGALTKTTVGTLTLSGTNSYSGVTNINAGVVNLGSAGALSGTGNVTFGGGTLQYSASNQQDVSSKISSSTAAIKVDTNGQNVTYATALGGAHTNGLTLNDTNSTVGRLTLTGVNQYSGATSVSAGNLQVGNGGVVGGALGTGSVTSAVAATSTTFNTTATVSGVDYQNAPLANQKVVSGPTISGTGTITGNVTLGTGTNGLSVGVFRPGDSGGTSNGQLNITGDIVVSNGSQIQLQISNSTSLDPNFNWSAKNAKTYLDNITTSSQDYIDYWKSPFSGSSYDTVKVTGNITLGTGSSTTYPTILVTTGNSPSFSLGGIYKLFDWSSVGTADSLKGTGSFVLDTDFVLPDLVGGTTGLSWDTSAFTSYGVVVVVPEPSRVLLLFLGLAALFMRRRRH